MTIRSVLLALSVFTSVCASAYDILVPLGGASVRTEAEADADFARVRGFDSHRPVFVLGVRERDPAVRAEQMKGLAANVRMAKARGLGPTAAWTWSFWCSSLDGFTPLTASDGWTSPQLACPLCPNFRAFAGDYLVEMAKCGVDMILLDDDYRYGDLHGSELLCTCPLHMAKIETILGERIAPAELKRKVLSGGKNRYRDAWMKVNGEALTDFAAFLRTRIDAVDPKIRIGLCAVMSHWDNDGVDAATTARILAGGTRPFLRLIGAPYWSVNRSFYDARLQNIIEFVRMERSWVTGDDIEIVSEGDTYPRPRQSCPASYLELYDLALRASGEVGGILKYGIDYYKPEREDGYLVRHRKNRPIAAEIERAFGGKTAVGLRIYEKMNRLADVEIPESWAGTTKIFELFGSEAAKYASDLGVPTVWQGEGIAGIAFGPNVEAVPAEARRRGLIVDAWGAWTLQQKGVDVGVRAFGAKYQAGVESGPFGLGGSTFAYEAYRIEPAQGAEVVEYDADGKTPAAFVYRNAAGERYMVLPHETYFNNPSWHRTYKAGRMLAKGVRMLTGRELSAFVGGNPDVYVIAKDGADGARAVGVFNMYADELIDQPVEIDREFAEVRFINCTGRIEGKRVILKSVPAWSFAGFEVKGRKGKGFEQIKDLPDSFVVNDGVEFTRGNKIPLWLFGFLY